MATLRRAGFGSVFEVENETVGIGTTGTATNTVQVLGETKASNALVSGISSLAIYQGFIDDNAEFGNSNIDINSCLLYTSPSPRDRQKSRMPSSA